MEKVHNNVVLKISEGVFHSKSIDDHLICHPFMTIMDQSACAFCDILDWSIMN
jgi:hypothetical protein